MPLAVAWVFVFTAGFSASAQQAVDVTDHSSLHVHDEKCGAVFMEQLQERELGVFGSKEYFESWLARKKKEVAATGSRLRQMEDSEIRRIPVVVHIIHTGTPVGVEANIPDAQVFSQIEILNQDFRRLNPDAVDTPPEFVSVAGDPRIEFVLAKQDPSGMPTNGINRVRGPRDSYPLGFNAQISELAYWPAEEYLNLWVLPLQSPNIGYASFPVASNLPGLNFPPPTRMTDGVTIDYRYFGVGGNALPVSRGRTATHEVGHFFGLRHIWGDGGCGIDDFVDDTPEQGFFTVGCPPHPRSSCSSVDMFQNFMDYTSDVCMNLFTQGQIERMNTVLAFSPRRNSLLTSRGLQEPELLQNNLQLDKIIDPFRFICSEEVVPKIVVSNVGENLVEQAEVQIRLNDQVLQTRSFDLFLSVGTSDTLFFDPIVLTSSFNFFEAEILTVNGGEDEDPFNNYLNSMPSIASTTGLPFLQSEEGLERWDIFNPDNLITWAPIMLSLDGVSEEAVFLNGFNYNLQGEVDYLISPVFSLVGIDNPQLSFDLAFAPFDSDQFQDGLMVAVSLDCGNTFDAMDYLYNRRDDSLATQPRTFIEFFPSRRDQFRKEVVDLSAYAGNESVRVALLSVNGFGNNIFVKNLALHDQEVYRYNFRIAKKTSPLPITAGLQEVDEVVIENTGNLPIEGFLVDVFMNGRSSEVTTLLITDFGLGIGESRPLELPDFYRFGQNRIDYRIYRPNFDQNGRNSSNLRWHIVQDSSSIAVPWRQDFDRTEALGRWIRINPERNFSSWRVLSEAASGNNFLGLTAIERGDSYWFASPVFDLSGTDRAGLFFVWSGAGFSTSSELAFEVWVSTDGGVTGTSVWRTEGGALNTGESGQPPSVASPELNRREFINFSPFTGQDNVRVYFKVSDQGAPGASLFLDDLELFLSDNPNPVDPGLNNTALFPNPARERFQLAFNFSEFEEVVIRVISPDGKVVLEAVKPHTLNQTYTFDTVKFSKGVYIVQISSRFFAVTKKLIIN
ncbi:hypothetical protein ADIS_0006 [Lunatimonas lonarensis]|uniref:Peptidase M43 pregnancy-associated plasma-A domain-containing protein n=1 Tax=Lunatimonas lonarensis TaxID=1232681 RepID=R7ZZF9_9BACT|nr:M43 family zinc metalloprotease [Lunatimonas lonarensis]EON79439.1 hypothetical protein ADIS_0006 [Lunatimonas lonarensis]